MLDRQTVRLAGLPDVQGYGLVLYTIAFLLALQDSRRGGGGTHSKSSLALPLFVSSDQ